MKGETVVPFSEIQRFDRHPNTAGLTPAQKPGKGTEREAGEVGDETEAVDAQLAGDGAAGEKGGGVDEAQTQGQSTSLRLQKEREKDGSDMVEDMVEVEMDGDGMVQRMQDLGTEKWYVHASHTHASSSAHTHVLLRHCAAHAGFGY